MTDFFSFNEILIFAFRMKLLWTWRWNKRNFPWIWKILNIWWSWLRHTKLINSRIRKRKSSKPPWKSFCSFLQLFKIIWTPIIQMLMISTEVNYSFNFAFSLNNTFLLKLGSAIIFLIAVLKFLPKVTPGLQWRI